MVMDYWKVHRAPNLTRHPPPTQKKKNKDGKLHIYEYSLNDIARKTTTILTKNKKNKQKKDRNNNFVAWESFSLDISYVEIIISFLASTSTRRACRPKVLSNMKTTSRRAMIEVEEEILPPFPICKDDSLSTLKL